MIIIMMMMSLNIIRKRNRLISVLVIMAVGISRQMELELIPLIDRLELLPINSKMMFFIMAKIITHQRQTPQVHWQIATKKILEQLQNQAPSN